MKIYKTSRRDLLLKRMYLGVDAAVHRVLENVFADELVASPVLFLCLTDQLGQPMRVPLHPITAKAWIAFFGFRICNPLAVEDFTFPFSAVQLVHADGHGELVGQLGKGGVTFAEQEIAGTLGS
jgi:hypothetical protein